MVENSQVLPPWPRSRSSERSRGSKTFRNPPQPHMCIQDYLEGSQEPCYINVLSWEKIALPSTPEDYIPLYGGMQVPHSPPSHSPVFAVMANPEVLRAKGKHAADPQVETHALILMLLDFVELMNRNRGLHFARHFHIEIWLGELKNVWAAVQMKRAQDTAARASMQQLALLEHQRKQQLVHQLKNSVDRTVEVQMQEEHMNQQQLLKERQTLAQRELEHERKQQLVHQLKNSVDRDAEVQMQDDLMNQQLIKERQAIAQREQRYRQQQQQHDDLQRRMDEFEMEKYLEQRHHQRLLHEQQRDQKRYDRLLMKSLEPPKTDSIEGRNISDSKFSRENSTALDFSVKRHPSEDPCLPVINSVGSHTNEDLESVELGGTSPLSTPSTPTSPHNNICDGISLKYREQEYLSTSASESDYTSDDGDATDIDTELDAESDSDGEKRHVLARVTLRVDSQEENSFEGESKGGNDGGTASKLKN
ncbi:PIH1 domain-containing protein 2 [Frankliniella fusca]|uniref:PIH1 domain-containing protein 2 n=1 Tax=Frankliniella fusca TaxID=407009 RepID=A0AAE1HQ96_9NEOP|nr:PIH1 domain-containing protein 2 [Frankliniella fusca]